MAIHKMNFEDFDTIDYSLIAIHTSLEDFRLAYKINQQLAISMRKNDDEITIQHKNQDINFARFTFVKKENMTVWDLIQNKQEIEEIAIVSTDNLFKNDAISSHVSLITELKKVDFFLKIEHYNQEDIVDIITKINKIEAVNTSYEIDVEAIKSKNNLIF